MKTFKSPDDLRRYALALASFMKAQGYQEQASILEARANLPCTTGWEWLGELSEGINQIRRSGKFPEKIEEMIDYILKATKSEKPYG